MAYSYNELSSEQQELIDRAENGENVLVDACIGSGKTTAIQALCDTLKNKSILYLTYNKLLKIDAKKKIKRKGVFVQNYHGFASYCLWKAGTSSGISDLIQSFNRKKPRMPHFDLLVLDEYQDVEQELAEMLEIIKESNPRLQIIAVGDMKQKIYDKTTLDVPAFMDKFLGKHTLMQFTRCFRLNKDYAEKLGRIWGKSIVGVNGNCKVELMQESEAVKFIAAQDTADILCLGARTGAMSRTLNILEEKYSEKFNKKTVYASIADSDKGTVSPDDSSAIFTTFDSSKGLERRICVVFDYAYDYWFVRLSQPMVNYEILRNIFCVAASRGKERIIFVYKNREQKLLTEKELTMSMAMHSTFEKPLNMSEMFDFKYKEDVESCFQLLKIKKIERGDDSIIDIQSNDCLIDLAPCIGIYQEAIFFQNYDIEGAIEFAKQIGQFNPKIPNGRSMEELSLDERILYLTAIETTYMRYCTQVQTPFVPEEKADFIYERLRSVFDPYEQVQVGCGINFKDKFGNTIVLSGRIDVLKDDTVYELKFVHELTHEHYLQAACYAAARGQKKAIIWNTMNNTMYEIQIKNRIRFLDAVVNCVTKGAVKEYIPSDTAASHAS